MDEYEERRRKEALKRKAAANPWRLAQGRLPDEAERARLLRESIGPAQPPPEPSVEPPHWSLGPTGEPPSLWSLAQRLRPPMPEPRPEPPPPILPPALPYPPWAGRPDWRKALAQVQDTGSPYGPPKPVGPADAALGIVNAVTMPYADILTGPVAQTLTEQWQSRRPEAEPTIEAMMPPELRGTSLRTPAPPAMQKTYWDLASEGTERTGSPINWWREQAGEWQKQREEHPFEAGLTEAIFDPLNAPLVAAKGLGLATRLIKPQTAAQRTAKVLQAEEKARTAKLFAERAVAAQKGKVAAEKEAKQLRGMYRQLPQPSVGVAPDLLSAGVRGAPEVGGAVVGGIAYQDDPNLSPEENLRNRALYAAGGAAIGYGGRRLGAASRLGGTIEDASKFSDRQVDRLEAIYNRVSQIEDEVMELEPLREAQKQGTGFQRPHLKALLKERDDLLAEQQAIERDFDRLYAEAEAKLAADPVLQEQTVIEKPKGVQAGMFAAGEAPVEFPKAAKPGEMVSEADLLGRPQYADEVARVQAERARQTAAGQGEMFGKQPTADDAASRAAGLAYEELAGDESTARGLMEWYYHQTGNWPMELRMRQGDTVPRVELSKAQRMAQGAFSVKPPEPVVAEVAPVTKQPAAEAETIPPAKAAEPVVPTETPPVRPAGQEVMRATTRHIDIDDAIRDLEQEITTTDPMRRYVAQKELQDVRAAKKMGVSAFNRMDRPPKGMGPVEIGGETFWVGRSLFGPRMLKAVEEFKAAEAKAIQEAVGETIPPVKAVESVVPTEAVRATEPPPVRPAGQKVMRATKSARSVDEAIKESHQQIRDSRTPMERLDGEKALDRAREAKRQGLAEVEAVDVPPAGMRVVRVEGEDFWIDEEVPWNRVSGQVDALKSAEARATRGAVGETAPLSARPAVEPEATQPKTEVPQPEPLPEPVALLRQEPVAPKAETIPPAPQITPAQQKVLDTALKAVTDGRARGVKAWLGPDGKLYIERGTGGQGYSYSTVDEAGKVTSGAADIEKDWPLVADAASAPKPPAVTGRSGNVPPRKPPALPGRGAGVPPEEPPIFGRRSAGGPVTQTTFGDPVRPTKPTGWQPSDRPVGGPQNIKPPPPDEPLSKLDRGMREQYPTVGERARKKKTYQDALDWLMRQLYYRNHTLHRVEGSGIPVRDLAQLVAGSMAAGQDTVARLVRPLWGKAGADIEALRKFLILESYQDGLARFGPDYRGPYGMQGWQDYTKEIDLLKAQLGPERFGRLQEIGKGIQKLDHERILKPYEAEGIVDEAGRVEMMTANPHYIPFYRDIDDIDPLLERRRPESSLGSTGMEKLREQAGSTLPVRDPLTAIEAKFIDAEVRISRNQAARGVGLSLLKLQNQALEQAGHTDMLRLPVKDQLARALASGQKARAEFDVLEWFDEGKRVRLEVPRDIAKVAKNLEKEPTHWLLQMFAAMAQPFRAGVITYSPAWAPVNTLYNLVTGYVQEGLHPFMREYWQGWWAALTRNTDFSEAAQNRILLGGLAERPSRMTAEEAAKGIFDLRVRNPVDALTLLPRAFRYFNAASEQAPRIAVYKRLRQTVKEIDTPEARVLEKRLHISLAEIERRVRARNAILDFSKSGYAIQALAQIIPFMNPPIQQTANIINLIKKNPKAAMVRATPFAAATVGVYLLNQRYDKELRDKISLEARARYWPVIIGEYREPTAPRYPNKPGERRPIVIYIPKTPVGTLLTAPIETALMMAEGQSDYTPQELAFWAARSYAQSISPVDLSMSGVTPPGIGTMWQVSQGKDEFRQRDIVPPRLQQLPPEMQYDPSTSKTAVALGQKTGISPMLIDFAVRDYLGGAGQTGTWLSDMALRSIGYDPETMGSAFRRERTDVEELATVPVISRFLRTPNSGDQKDWQRLNEAVAESQRVLGAIKETRRLGVTMGPVGDSMSSNGRTIVLEPGERAVLQSASAKVAKAVVEQLVMDPNYQRQPDAVKLKLLRKRIDEAREATREAYRQSMPEDEFQRRIVEGSAVPLTR